MTMQPDELKRRVSDFSQFGTPEVTERIETLTRREVVELSRDPNFSGALEEGVRKLQKWLNDQFIDREEMIEMALACFIAHIPMIALGPPGTAKSLVFRQLAKGLGLQQSTQHIDELKGEMHRIMLTLKDGQENLNVSVGRERQYFEYLVTRYTTPDELLGPANLDLMIKGALFYRQTTGLLPEAQVAFLDEIFKANSAILNALLSILNERLFYNAGRASRVPLCMVFGASNEPPAEEELWALYDRFPVRVLCRPVEDTQETLHKLLDRSLSQASHAAMNGGSGNGGPDPLATVNHFRLLNRIAMVKEEDRGEQQRLAFRKQFLQTFSTLRREFQISDRSMSHLYRLCGALAVVRQHDMPRTSELEVFQYCFRDPDAAPALEDAVRDRVRRLQANE